MKLNNAVLVAIFKRLFLFLLILPTLLVSFSVTPADVSAFIPNCENKIMKSYIILEN